MLRTLEQNKRLHKLLGMLKISGEAKEDLIYSFTNKRETSSSKMEVRECQNLNNHLQHLVNELGFAEDDRANVMRKKILSVCHEMNWKLENGTLDWERLNAWLMKYGYLHKELNEYSYKELPKLVTQFENMIPNFYKKL